MREIKFRAWFKNEIAEQMLFDENPGDCLVWKNQGQDIEVIMQYTGLKDKNGKEIYEGDVVKGYYWERGNEHRFIGQVKYLGSAFKVVGVKQYYGMHQELHSVYEVIGNIHENPELLK